MRKIIKLYKKDLSRNLSEIDQVLKNKGTNNPKINNYYNKILSSSCAYITGKWLTGRKCLRTLFIKEAFADFYPQKITRTSIYMDAIINILDDLLDEKINEEKKRLYILELLRVLSLHYYEYSSKEVQGYLGSYFNKLISLAIMEEYYKNLIKKKKKIKKIIDYSVKVLNCRSMDLDIFNEIVISNGSYNYSEKERIKKIGRIFRSLNIMKKDIEDLEYDKKTGQESIVSKMAEKKNCNFCDYVLSVSDYYLDEKNKIKSMKSINDSYIIPMNNFCNMIDKDRNEIIKLAKKI